MSWDAQRYQEGLEAGRKESAAEIERLTKMLKLEPPVISAEEAESLHAEIERLRADNQRLRGMVAFDMKGAPDLQAENERLRAERDDAREQRRKWQEASVADRADNHRLTAALQKVVDLLGDGDDGACWYQSAAEVARDALEQKSKPE
jgi:hypothetical protein